MGIAWALADAGTVVGVLRRNGGRHAGGTLVHFGAEDVRQVTRRVRARIVWGEIEFHKQRNLEARG